MLSALLHIKSESNDKNRASICLSYFSLSLSYMIMYVHTADRYPIVVAATR